MMDEIVDAQYDRTFEAAYNYGRALVEDNREHGIFQVRGMLKALYVRQGDDIHGRGDFGDADICATIAAYEQVISDCEGELKVRADKTTMGLS